VTIYKTGLRSRSGSWNPEPWSQSFLVDPELFLKFSRSWSW